MSNKKQFETDAQALEYLRGIVRDTEWNADIAREAIRIAERNLRKADNQRMMLNQLQKGGGAESIDKRVVQDALLERISRLNAEGEKSVNVARELIRFKRFVDGLTPFAEPKTETVLCALADRACPFQGQEYAWCLTCPHISEEDMALVKKAVTEPKTGLIPVSDIQKLQDILYMHIDSLEGTRNIVEAGMLSAWKEVAEYVDGMLGEDGEE